MSRRSIRMSASVVADVCVGRYGCLRRSVRMSASVGADVCVGRCGYLRQSMRMVKIKRKRRLMPPLSLFYIGCLVGAAETAAPPGGCACCFPQISHSKLVYKNSHGFHRFTQNLLTKSICVNLRNLWENFSAEGSVCSANSVGEYLNRRFCVFCEICGRISQ